jgi:hypothetical protein
MGGFCNGLEAFWAKNAQNASCLNCDFRMIDLIDMKRSDCLTFSVLGDFHPKRQSVGAGLAPALVSRRPGLTLAEPARERAGASPYESHIPGFLNQSGKR